MNSLFNSIKKFGYEQLDTVDVVDPSTIKPEGVPNYIQPRTQITSFEKVVLPYKKSHKFNDALFEIQVATREVKTGHFVIGHVAETKINAQIKKDNKLWSVSCIESDSNNVEHNLDKMENQLISIINKI